MLSDSLYKINHHHLINKIIHIQQINLILKIKDSNPDNKIHINKVHIKFLLILNNKIIKDSNQLHLDNIDHHLLHLSKLKLWYNCLAIYQRDIVNILFIFLAKYAFIMEQSRMPCPVCHFQGVDYVSLTPGCAAYSWSICLFIFTGLLCFWIPFVCDGCKDIKISCSKCRRTKCIIEKPCC